MNIEEFIKKHGYEIKDLWLPRVTSITGIIAKPALFRYYASQKNYASAEESLNNAASWGTLTHETVEKLFKGEDCEINPKIMPSIQAFYEWQKKNSVRILDAKLIEKQVVDLEDYYAGTMDALIEVNGQVGVLDIKTGTGIWDEYSLQLAAYFHAYNKNAPKKKQAQTRWILRLDQYEECIVCGAKRRWKSGQAKVTGGCRDNYNCQHKFTRATGNYEFKELNDYENDIQAFLSAKELWEWYYRKYLGEIKNYPKKHSNHILF